MSMLRNEWPTQLNVPRETIDKLEAYFDLLQQWQQHINLVAPSTLADTRHRHMLDSLQLLPLLPDKHAVIVDIGSGAGFPGLVLAMAGYTKVYLVESDGRKCAFLREAARICGCTPTILHGRVESLEFPLVDVFTSRACSSTSTLLNMLGSRCQKNTISLFHKGKNYTKELEAVTDWTFDLKIHPSVVASDSVILELSHINKGVAP